MKKELDEEEMEEFMEELEAVDKGLHHIMEMKNLINNWLRRSSEKIQEDKMETAQLQIN